MIIMMMMIRLGFTLEMEAVTVVEAVKTPVRQLVVAVEAAQVVIRVMVVMVVRRLMAQVLALLLLVVQVPEAVVEAHI